MPCHRTGYDRYKIRTPATQILYNDKREKGKDKEGHKIKKSSRRQPEPTHEALSWAWSCEPVAQKLAKSPHIRVHAPEPSTMATAQTKKTAFTKVFFNNLLAGFWTVVVWAPSRRSCWRANYDPVKRINSTSLGPRKGGGEGYQVRQSPGFFLFVWSSVSVSVFSVILNMETRILFEISSLVFYFRVVCIFWRNTYARLIDNTIIPERASVALTTITIECFPRFSSFFCQERGKTGKNVSFISIFVFIFWPSHFLSSPVAFSLL